MLYIIPSRLIKVLINLQRKKKTPQKQNFHYGSLKEVDHFPKEMSYRKQIRNQFYDPVGHTQPEGLFIYFFIPGILSYSIYSTSWSLGFSIHLCCILAFLSNAMANPLCHACAICYVLCAIPAGFQGLAPSSSNTGAVLICMKHLQTSQLTLTKK